MNAHVTGFARPNVLSDDASSSDATSAVRRYIDAHVFECPTLVVDRALVAQNYRALSASLGPVKIHYAVKANPASELLEMLTMEGCNFDAASLGEVDACLAAGATPDRISFGNTVKRASDIVRAHAKGITLFAADSIEELTKLATHAPGAQVYIRVIVEHSQADWPLSRKFGCAATEVSGLMTQATLLGLQPVGISFHVGSQTRHPEMWAATLDEMSALWTSLKADGHDLSLLNIGGGFPAFYGEDVTGPMAYGTQVLQMVQDRFGHVPHIMAEPGRGMVANAGMIAAEVMLVSRKSADDLHRWVYLDIGKFSGLAETIDEAIRYQFVTPHDGGETGPCVMAGPSCDSADVLYEKRPMQLPLALASGDRFLILNAGAYTSSYSSVGFNGFPPLDVVIL